MGHEEQRVSTGATRVLYVAAVFPPAKVAEADHALHQCIELAGRGYEVHVLTTAQEGIARPAGVHVHPAMERWSWRELPRLWRVLRQVRPSIAMLFFLGTLFHYSTMVLMLPFLVRLAVGRCRMITQFSNIGDGAPSDGRWSSRAKRMLFKVLGPFRLGGLLIASDSIVLLSEVYRERLRRFYLAEPVIRRTVIIPPTPLLPMASDPQAARSRGRERLGVTDSETLVSFFGRLYPGKGIEPLVEAAGDLRDRYPGLRVALIGGFLSAEHFWTTSHSYADELQALLAEVDLGDRVITTGEYAWDSVEASEYLYASDMVVLALAPGVHLYNSSFAAVCAHGLPVAITVGAIRERSLHHGDNVFVLRDGSRDAIGEAISAVVDDDALRTRLAAGALKLAHAWFDRSRATDRLIALFEGGVPPVPQRSSAPS